MFSSTICGSAAILRGGVEIEPVAGVAFEPEFRGAARPPRGCGRIRDRAFSRLAVRDGVAPGAGVQFDHGRADGLRGLQRVERGLDEQRDAHARALQFVGDDR